MYSYSINEFFVDYIRWHYGQGVKELFNLSKNILNFLSHFFSIKLLFYTLLSPIYRMKEEYSKGLDMGAIFSALIVNTVMRLVGLLTRSVIISLGLLSYIIALGVSVVVFVLWVAFPLLIVAIFGGSVILILSAI